MLITLSRHTAICESVSEIFLTRVAPLGAVSHRSFCITLYILWTIYSLEMLHDLDDVGRNLRMSFLIMEILVSTQFRWCSKYRNWLPAAVNKAVFSIPNRHNRPLGDLVLCPSEISDEATPGKEFNIVMMIQPFDWKLEIWWINHH